MPEQTTVLTTETQTKKIKTGVLRRSFELNRAELDEESREIPLSFSSEEPYERWWGTEILSHDKKHVRMGRLKNKAPLLVDHNHRDQVGVIEDASIGKDKRGRAVVRFGKSARAEEIFQDVLDEIRVNVSVGYIIHKMKLEETSEKGDADVYRAVDWEPLEVSIVSVPADTTVGVGREAEDKSGFETIVIERATKQEEPTGTNQEPPAVDQDKLVKDLTTPIKEKDMPEVDIEQIKAEARETAITETRTAELTRVKEILAIGERHGMSPLAQKAVQEGTSVDDFKGQILEAKYNAKPIENPDPNIGMEQKDLKKYSLLRAIRAAASGDWREAELERECSEAVGKKLGKAPRSFFLPYDVMVESRDHRGALNAARDLNVGTATAGGNLVATDLLMGSFIELLRNRMMVKELGATVLSGLVGDIAIPKQTGAATGYWLAEGGDTTESEQTIGQVTLTPKTVAGLTEYTRKLMQQTSMDVENFVRADLATVLALAMDLAAIAGTGTSNQPTGILNQSGVGLVAMGTDGGAPTYGSTIDLETEISIDNADIGSMAYLTNTKVRGKMKQVPLETGYPKYIWEKGTRPGFGEVNGYPAAVSNQVPSNLDKGTSTGVCSAMLFGVWSQLLIGLWGGLDILVDPFTKSASGGMRVVAFQDSDIALRHAESFAVVKDYLTT